MTLSAGQPRGLGAEEGKTRRPATGLSAADYVVFTNPEEGAGVSGVHLCLRRQWRPWVKTVVPVSTLILLVRLKGQTWDVSYAAAHAPLGQAPAWEKKQFCRALY